VAADWPAVNYASWRETCDTLHAHAQVLGKIAVALAPPEPQLQHAALRLTPRGWETRPLPAPNGSGALVVALDLQEAQAFVEHSSGSILREPLVPDRSVGHVARAILENARELVGEFDFNPKPSEVPWTVPLDEDEEHAHYDEDEVAAYLRAATQAALVLAEYRAPYRGRSTPVNAWWGSFDLAVSLFSGESAKPPSDDFILRNSMDVEEVAAGWWPGDARHERAAFYAYAHPAVDGFADLDLEFGSWNTQLGEYLLDWDDIRSTPDPHGVALDFLRRVFRHACAICDWDPQLAASAEGSPPPVR
jgi:hypothetical protein